MSTMIALMLAMAPAQAVAKGQVDQAWSLGYTSFVRQACPAWDQRTDIISPQVMPRPENWNGAWAPDGMLAVAHRGGVRAAEAGQRGDPGFCDHPAHTLPAHTRPARAALLNRILVRRSPAR